MLSIILWFGHLQRRRFVFLPLNRNSQHQLRGHCLSPNPGPVVLWSHWNHARWHGETEQLCGGRCPWRWPKNLLINSGPWHELDDTFSFGCKLQPIISFIPTLTVLQPRFLIYENKMIFFFKIDQDTSSYLSRHVASILKVTSWSQLATSVPAIVSTFPANNRGG